MCMTCVFYNCFSRQPFLHVIECLQHKITEIIKKYINQTIYFIHFIVAILLVPIFCEIAHAFNDKNKIYIYIY